ncbi:microtubule associated-domain-containing protein [Sporodiniella umbellata]|nr:microtubule associated-domain-containing protein [Sporodiniella umbellata]
MDDDFFSMTNVSLLEDTENSDTQAPSLEKSKNSKSLDKKKGNYSFSKPLKQQEQTVDHLKKENFDLRLKIYFMENRMQELSSSDINYVLKENKDLKGAIQKLGRELQENKRKCLKPSSIVCQPVFEHSEERSIAHEEAAYKSTSSTKPLQHSRSKKSTKPVFSQPSQGAHALGIVIDYSQENFDLKDRLKKLEQELKSQGAEKNSLIHENNTLIASIERKESRIKELLAMIYSFEAKSSDSRPEQINQPLSLKKLEKEVTQYKSAMDTVKKEAAQQEILCQSLKHLKEENKMLLVEVESREREIIDLEEEINKLLSFVEGKIDEDCDERSSLFKGSVQDQSLVALQRELENMRQSYEEDVKELEKHIVKTQYELQEKDKLHLDLISRLKQVCREAETTKRICREKHKKQMDELAIMVREKDVSMATLRGNYNAREDTMEREKELMKEEIKALKQQLRFVTRGWKTKEEQAFKSELKKKSEEKKQRVSYTVDKWKEKATRFENKYREQMVAYRALKHQWLSAHDQNEILSKLLHLNRKEIKTSKAEEMLQRLNYELQKDLEDKNRNINQLEVKLQKLEESRSCESALHKREHILPLSFFSLDSTDEYLELKKDSL